MEEKNVVTCFLEFNGKILILKRSEKVGSNRGKWAGVTGYIESIETPYQTALKEVFQETNLTPEDAELITRGKLFSVPHNKNMVWKVYPYLFRVKNPDKIEINWEHKETKWIKPEDLFKYKTIPKFREALERVYC